MMKHAKLAAAVSLALALAACGGSSSAPAAAPAAPAPVVAPPPPPPPPPASDLQTSVAAATYAPGSQELAFFTGVNDFRGKVGLGLLAQSAKLDKSSANHLAYVLANADVDFAALDANGMPLFHSEDPARPGYTGKTVVDRVNFAQYASVYVGEEGGFGSGKGAIATLNSFVDSVYHRAALMAQSPRDIGVAVGSNAAQTLVVNFGYETKLQYNASNYFGSYPADKQTGVRLIAGGEAPNPFPGVAYSDYATKTSYPINVVSAAFTTLAVTTFTVTEAGATAPLDVRQLNASTSAQDKTFLAANTAFIVGRAPFKANTTYNVSFVGTVNGAAVSKVWSFTTGS